MKKLLVVAVVLAIACMGSMAFAADVTVNGYVDVRSRDFQNLDLNRSMNNADTASRTTTETAYRIDVNVKADNAKAKISLWNDHDVWGLSSSKNPNSNLDVNNTGSATNEISGYTSMGVPRGMAGCDDPRHTGWRQGRSHAHAARQWLVRPQ